jgi:hypothetical protein
VFDRDPIAGLARSVGVTMTGNAALSSIPVARMRLALAVLFAVAFAAVCAFAAYGYLDHHAALVAGR